LGAVVALFGVLGLPRAALGSLFGCFWSLLWGIFGTNHTFSVFGTQNIKKTDLWISVFLIGWSDSSHFRSFLKQYTKQQKNVFSELWLVSFRGTR
jgi:hypothetical protein